MPGINSSRIHILDTKPDPRQPKIVKVIEPETLAQRTGYASPHTVHCGPDGIFMSALGAPDGNGPGGTFAHGSRDVRRFVGRWEIDRGPQQLAYDIWWHLGCDTMVTSTWGTPNMVKDGVNPELLAGRQVRKQPARLGSAPPAPRAGAVAWRGAADDARAAPGARPDPRLRVRGRGDLAQGSLVVDLAVVPRGQAANGDGQTASGRSRK